MQLEDWLDDLCVRFIINLPPEELASVERICFQVEEAQWFYEDFIRPLDPSLPSLSLRAFSLRIFQHCPLFSQWSAQHQTAAFAEFLAYKSRVPVRGAILLSEAMDEVVLVKGWKKSANWSFPRGKINKDENDLDCAVREVYEETGFDAREAGLIRDESEMKYIEVTMREQHMRLYVFRGVPKDAHFEPKTRKEISKIEWYKLTDLPTLKRNRQHEGSGTENAALSANKFYMVAPFLNPLKKWIAQQKKKENRYSSHLSAPPMVAEEASMEEEEDPIEPGANLARSAHGGISDLPEVSAIPAFDATSHLKEMLQIGNPRPQPQTMPQTAHIPDADTQKPNALLALLRGDQERQAVDVLSSAAEQISVMPKIQQVPQGSQLTSPHLEEGPRFPSFQASFKQDASVQSPHQSWPAPPPRNGPSAVWSEPAIQIPPYQRMGDPLSVPQGSAPQYQPMVPPASALPKLTNHTKALLDVFKNPASLSKSSISPAEPARSTAALETDTTPRPVVRGLESMNIFSSASAAVPGGPGAIPSPILHTARQPTAVEPNDDHVPVLPRSSQNAQKASLLQLFGAAPQSKAVSPPVQATAPVELAANSTSALIEKPKPNKDDLLLSLLRQGKSGVTPKVAETRRPLPREGETSATISGPLNQPEFEVISKDSKQSVSDMGRSPLTSNRTLFDPNAPAPVKILTRPEESRPPPPRSPRPGKPASKKNGREKVILKEQAKEQPKPFQPQILRRPQTIESSASNVVGVPPPQNESTAPRAVAIGSPPTIPAAPAASAAAPLDRPVPSRETSHSDAQKQKLLSLFGGGLDTTPRATPMPPSSGIVSPLSTSQIMGSLGEAPTSGMEPISTQSSRVGSMVSMISGTGTMRPTTEKRQTGAENKAFLLGYLGRIASQEHS